MEANSLIVKYRPAVTAESGWAAALPVAVNHDGGEGQIDDAETG
jgi:hypothetical protein